MHPANHVKAACEPVTWGHLLLPARSPKWHCWSGKAARMCFVLFCTTSFNRRRISRMQIRQTASWLELSTFLCFVLSATALPTLANSLWGVSRPGGCWAPSLVIVLLPPDARSCPRPPTFSSYVRVILGRGGNGFLLGFAKGVTPCGQEFAFCSRPPPVPFPCSRPRWKVSRVLRVGHLGATQEDNLKSKPLEWVLQLGC